MLPREILDHISNYKHGLNSPIFSIYDFRIDNKLTKDDIVNAINSCTRYNTIYFTNTKDYKIDFANVEIVLSNITKILTHVDYFKKPTHALLCYINRVLEVYCGCAIEHNDIFVKFFDYIFDQKIDWTNIINHTSHSLKSILNLKLFKYLYSKKNITINWLEFISLTFIERLSKTSYGVQKWTNETNYDRKLFFEYIEMCNVLKPKPSVTQILESLYSVRNGFPIGLLDLFYEKQLKDRKYFSQEMFEFAIKICYNNVIDEMVNNKYIIEEKHIDMMINEYKNSKSVYKEDCHYRIINFLNMYYSTLNMTDEQIIYFISIYFTPISYTDYQTDDKVKEELMLKVSNKSKYQLYEACQKELIKKLCVKKYYKQLAVCHIDAMLKNCGELTEKTMINLLCGVQKNVHINRLLKNGNYITTPEILSYAKLLDFDDKKMILLNKKLPEDKQPKPKKKVVKKKKVIDESESEEDETQKKKVVKKIIKKKVEIDTDTSDSEEEIKN